MVISHETFINGVIYIYIIYVCIYMCVCIYIYGNFSRNVHKWASEGVKNKRIRITSYLLSYEETILS